MRNKSTVLHMSLPFALAATFSSAPALCAPVPAQTRSSAAAHALFQQDYVLAPQERNNNVIASLPHFRPLKRAPMAIQTIPINMSVSPSSITGGSGNVTCTITVQEVPAEGGSVLVSCDYPNILHSPSGSWPYTFNFPSGSSTTRSFTITTSSVSSNTTIRAYSCESDLDISNPSNWQVLSSCLVIAPMQ